MVDIIPRSCMVHLEWKELKAFISKGNFCENDCWQPVYCLSNVRATLVEVCSQFSSEHCAAPGTKLAVLALVYRWNKKFSTVFLLIIITLSFLF